TTTLRDHAGARLFGQAVHGGTDHVVRVLSAVRFSDDILNTQHLKDCPHRTTGDNSGTLRRGAHDDLAGAVAAFHIVMQRAAFAQWHADHGAFGCFCGFADRLGDLFGLTLTKADTALLIAYDDQRGKAKALTTLDGF